MLENILRYQEIDKKLKTLNDSVKNSECRQKAIACKDYLSGVDDMVSKLNDEAFILNSKYEELVERCAQLNTKIGDYSNEIEECEDQQMLDYLLKKVQELTLNFKDLTSMMEKISSEINVVASKYLSIKNKTIKMKEDYLKFKSEFDELKKSISPEIEQTENTLKEMEKDIDPKLLEKYNHIKQQCFPVFVVKNGDNCGYCGMEFSQSALAGFVENDIVQCEECQRLVYKL